VTPPTLLAVLAHPDDEVLCAGTLLAQRAAGSRVVVLWLTRGEMTGAWGPLPTSEVAERRMELGMRVAERLGVEGRFLSFPDSAVHATPEAGHEVAKVMAEIKPDGLITWGDAWARGFRHPDHQETGKIARDAVNFARIAKVVSPAQPHRLFCPIFTLRGVHSSLPNVALDVTGYAEAIFDVAEIYRRAIGFGAPEWLEGRLRSAGHRWSRDLVEEFDAWETGSGLFDRLLPPQEGPFFHHPDRDV
jgi:LmbE family N-acetylglucosaminyl deacetylase